MRRRRGEGERWSAREAEIMEAVTEDRNEWRSKEGRKEGKKEGRGEGRKEGMILRKEKKGIEGRKEKADEGEPFGSFSLGGSAFLEERLPGLPLGPG